jgi:hypothetical protein
MSMKWDLLSYSAQRTSSTSGRAPGLAGPGPGRPGSHLGPAGRGSAGESEAVPGEPGRGRLRSESALPGTVTSDYCAAAAVGPHGHESLTRPGPRPAGARPHPESWRVTDMATVSACVT